MEPNRWLEAGKIIALCIVGACAYGVIHDQFTARAYLPYFTVWPPHANAIRLNSNDPTLVGLVWGVLATWWVGLILGIILAWVAVSGDAPALSWRDVLKPVGILLVVMGLLALLSFVGSLLTNFQASEDVAMDAVAPGDRQGLRMFSAVLVAHNISYFSGAIGALILAWIIRNRRKPMVFWK